MHRARIHAGPAAGMDPVAGAASAGRVLAGCEHRAEAAGNAVIR